MKKIDELKVRAYDLLVQRQNIQSELERVNLLIKQEVDNGCQRGNPSEDAEDEGKEQGTGATDKDAKR